MGITLLATLKKLLLIQYQIVAMVNDEEYVNVVIDELFETLESLQNDVMAIQGARA